MYILLSQQPVAFIVSVQHVFLRTVKLVAVAPEQPKTIAYINAEKI